MVGKFVQSGILIVLVATAIGLRCGLFSGSHSSPAAEDAVPQQWNLTPPIASVETMAEDPFKAASILPLSYEQPDPDPGLDLEDNPVNGQETSSRLHSSIEFKTGPDLVFDPPVPPESEVAPRPLFGTDFEWQPAVPSAEESAAQALPLPPMEENQPSAKLPDAFPDILPEERLPPLPDELPENSPETVSMIHAGDALIPSAPEPFFTATALDSGNALPELVPMAQTPAEQASADPFSTSGIRAGLQVEEIASVATLTAFVEPMPGQPDPAEAESFEPGLFASSPIEPTPTSLVPPPVPPVDATENAGTEGKEATPPDPLFQKRFEQLNRPLNGIQVGFPTEAGSNPPNRAAENTPQVPPILISGAAGWFEPRPNRYPVPFSYQPLYYEDLNLERCGVGHGFLQPLFSSAKFARDTVMLPYQLVVSPPRSEVQTPGDCPSCSRFPEWRH